MEDKNSTVEEVKDETENVEETTEEVVENTDETSKENNKEETTDNVVDFEEKLENNLQKELDDINDKYKRLQAEYSNFMRRTKEEKESIGLFANEKIINDLLPVFDSLDMALKSFDDKESNIYKGIELVHKNLQNTLTKYGVEEIVAEGADFDPNLHLAVMQENVDGVEANKVIDVMQKGYKLGKKVLRPSMVKVSC